jgi:FKBP-type peptidyl-prolyl cis-trans isomerase SlyD
MRIAANAVVSIDYTLRDETGRVLDSNQGDAPLAYLHGHDNLIPGLERELEGHAAGDALTVTVPPEDGYGPRLPSKVYVVERDRLPEGMVPEVGMQIGVEEPDGSPMSLWITNVTQGEVTLDANHPLAGKTLRFEVTVREVRQATAEEVEHGHVHDGDHPHH